eukprot:g7805.t1
MQYHTQSLLEKGLDVFVVGYPGSDPIPQLTSHPKFVFSSIHQTPQWILQFPGVLRFVLKTLYQLICLLVLLLWSLPKPEFVLVQLPPSIPTLWVCFLVYWIRGCAVYLDWHNFAYTLMAMNKKVPRQLMLLAKWIEMKCGLFATRHYCVSQSMRQELHLWGINATVFYDQPHERFHPASLMERHQLMKKLKPVFCTSYHVDDFCMTLHEDLEPEETMQTYMTQNSFIQLNPDRPALIISSTSWTIDEDFSILLDAAKLYDEKWRSNSVNHSRPRLIILVTGNGPMKEHYLQQMRQLDFSAIAFRTSWLEAADYPVLLGTADVGISLHTSSSGVDLPMKVVDMFGCHLPVCSTNYPTITELVDPGETGLLFNSSNELYQALWSLLEGFPMTTPLLTRMKRNLSQRQDRWSENWNTMWSRVFLNWFSSPSSFQNHENRRRSQRQNSTSKSSTPQSPSQNSTLDNGSQGWFGKASSKLTSVVAGVGASIRNKFPKDFDMPIKLDSDLIKPTFVSMRDATLEFWNGMTPHSRISAMCLGSAFLSGWLVQSIIDHDIKKERQKGTELKIQRNLLIEDRKMRSDAFLGDGVEYISKLTDALALATTASSRAAEAAAVAAESCAIRSRRGIRRVQ